MLGKLNSFCCALYVKTGDFVRSLRQDERGLSGVVVSVLLILVAVLAIVMLWGSLSEWLAELWEKITGAGGGISGGSSF